MAIYSVGRRRVIIALLLTSALLLTLDLRGNPILDRISDGFSLVMEPVESATDVVTTPIAQAWKGVTEYDDLERTNQSLQDEVDRLIGTQAAAELSVLEGQELKALINLPSLTALPKEVAKVVGESSNNLDQIIEINKGSLDGIRVGMPVVNQAGLIGRITSVSPRTSKVRLITDSRYTVAVRVQAAPAGTDDDPVTTSPSGRTNDELRDLVDTTLPSTTLVTDVLATATSLPQFDPDAVDGEVLDGEVATDPAAPGDPAAETPIDPAAPPTTLDPEAVVLVSTTTTTTTTTIPAEPESKEFGALEGRGRGLLPQIRFLQDNPGLSVLEVGDLVFTAGGSESLAPSDIPIGRVINRAERSGPGGPLLDIKPHADVTKLNFVTVVLFSPRGEVEQ